MAKTKKEKDDFFDGLAKQTGGKVLKSMASRVFFDTGNFALNYIESGRFMGGGVPTGITEIYGPPASAKSIIGYTILGLCQRAGGYAIVLDCERSANADFAKNAGHVNVDQLLIYEPWHFLEIESKITSLVKFIREKKGMDAPIVFLWDSIGVTMTEREFKELELPDNFTQADFKKIVGQKESPGERAKASGKLLRKINPFLGENNASLIVINQTRSSIGTYGVDETTAGGGRALPYYANSRIRTQAAKQIIDAKRDCPIGVNLKIKNKKSRSFVPMLQTEELQLYYDNGMNPLGGLLTVLMNAGRVESCGAGNWKVNEPWSEGKEYRFKASKDKNLIDVKVLLDCPKLIDAEDAEQIKSYLGVFGQAIDLANSEGVIKETEMNDGDDITSDDAQAMAIIEGKDKGEDE
jgi:recombination protein RecA